MKISTGGLGTVATAQAYNSKSVYPYQWAWNAVGTDVSSTGGFESGTIITQINSTVESDPYGIKCSPSDTAGGQSYTAYNDEGLTTPGGKVGGNRSGPLNGVDIRQAQYVHCVVDLLSGNKTGWADSPSGSILENFTDSWDAGNESPGDWNDGLFSYELVPATSVAGGVAIFPHSLNANTFILVWDPLTQIHKQGPPEGGEAGDPRNSEWGPDSPFPFTDPEKPFHLSLYPGFPFVNDTENYIIIMGWVIADRILTDIPLPIRTHMG